MSWTDNTISYEEAMELAREYGADDWAYDMSPEYFEDAYCYQSAKSLLREWGQTKQKRYCYDDFDY